MTAITRLRETPLLHSLVATQKHDVPWTVALRNTVAVVLPLVVGALTHRLAIGLGISVGALVCMFSDQPGPYRLRLQRMLLTALAAGVAAFVGAVLGHWPSALVAAAALWGFFAALLVAVGPHATRAGLTSMILLVIMGAYPAPPMQALGAAALVIAGGWLQTLFAIVAWPLQRYRPEQLALAQAMRDLAASARKPVNAGGVAALPPSLNDLQTLLFGAGRARGPAVEAFRVLAELAERIRMEGFALADLQTRCHASGLADAIGRVRVAATGVLDALAEALQHAAAPQTTAAFATFDAATAAVEALPVQPDTRVAVAHCAALGGQLRAASRNTDTAGSRGEIRAQSAESRLPRALRPANPGAILRANLRGSSPAFRHALRCGVCLAIAMVLSHLLPLSRSYWLPMTVAIVLKPDFGATWRYGLLRMAGTLGGLLVTTAILHFIGVGNIWIALALLAVLCFAYRELATVHYGIAVVCLTGLVVILLSFEGVPPEIAVHARAIDTVVGSLLALLAYLAWPTWERGRERETLARMLDAYRDYLVAVLHGDAHARRESRSAARAARSAAQASLDRLRAEPASRINLPRAEALVAQANRLVRAAMVLEAAHGDTATASTPESTPGAITAFSEPCLHAITEAAAALREQRAPVGAFRLREAQRALVAAFAAPAGAANTAFDAALLDASDRIVDAIDSLLHVLGQANGSA